MGRRRSTFLVIAGVTILIGVLGSGVAGARPTAIGAKQHFVGLVNGHAANATILMACPFPLHSGETSHPLSGQTLSVQQPSATSRSVGYTGSRGQSVDATFVLSSTADTSTVTFTKYGSQPIPDTFLLPCSGSGTVVFSAKPTSKAAQSATVTVNYGNITVDPPHSTTSSRTITVTQADSGHSYTLYRNDRLIVKLSGPSFYTWTEPASSDQSVLHRTEGSSGSKATGTFVVQEKGKAEVTAIDNPNCYPQCLPPSRLFEVSVSVVG